jgi:L-ribulose-5-phosphate 3-epimerase
VRVFTFLRQPNPLEPKRLARVKEHLLGLVEIAKGSGVRIGIENEHSCLIATADEMTAVLDGLPADQVGAIWDPCNVLYVPEAAPPQPANIAQLGRRLFHLHVKDSLRRPPSAAGGLVAVGMPIGTGEVDWRAHLRALQASGYRGMLSVETHWRLQKIDDSILHLPGGYGFSNGGEPASRICMHTLKAIVDAL